MIYPEIMDSLESLTDQEIGQMFRLIMKWNREEEVVPQTSLEKFVWATILPKLEENKKSYLEISEKRRQAVNKRWNKQEDTNVYKSIQENTNYNYNSNNTSKEVLYREEVFGDGQHETLGGVSVVEETAVSKGLETLENVFPQRKRDIGISEINLWNSLTQPQKANLIKKAVLYVRSESKKEDGKFIKKLSKWMKEECDKGIEEDMIPKKKSNMPRTFKYTDGNILAILEEKIGSTKECEYVYHTLNNYGLTKQEFYSVVKEQTKQELLNLIK